MLLAVVGNEEAMRLLLELRGGLLLMGSLNSGLVELKKEEIKTLQKKEKKCEEKYVQKRTTKKHTQKSGKWQRVKKSKKQKNEKQHALLLFFLTVSSLDLERINFRKSLILI